MKKMIIENGEHLLHKYEIFLPGLHFIIIWKEFLLSNSLRINFEIPQTFQQTFSKFNIKFPKYFLHPSLIFFHGIS